MPSFAAPLTSTLAGGGPASQLLSASSVLTGVTIVVAGVTMTMAFMVLWRIRRIRHSSSQAGERNPVRGLGFLLCLALLLLAGSVAASTRPRSAVRQDAEALNWFRGEAMMLDERLTMSARLAAATSDSRWEDRYRAAERELDRVLKESDALLDRLLGSDAVVAREGIAALGMYNDALISLENRCFESVRHGDRTAAMAAVISDEYEALKQKYKTAAAASDDAIGKLVSASIEHNERWAVAAGVLGVLSAGVMVGGTLLVALALARHSRTLAQRNRELLESRTQADGANQTKSEFLANMSHEIRTPVTAILGFADLLHENGQTVSPAQQNECIETIRRAGRHLLGIINDILDLSKIEAGRMTVERVEASVPSLLAEVESLLRPRALGKGLQFSTVLTTEIPERVATDPTRLRQILMNLAGNAVKFTEAGSVTIRAMMQSQGPRQQLVVDIEDTGPGMAVDGRERLFTPFVQGDSTVTRRFGGTGLGLTICRRLARLMDGDVMLLSSTPSVGSVFRLTLPVEPVAGCAMTRSITRTAPTLAEAPVPTRVTGRILLAEDGPDNRRLILFHLRKAGADVASAVDGREALAMIDRARKAGAPYELLLTDMQMPEIDGYDLARTLRRQGDTMPIIALTAHAMAEDRKRCIDAGCDDYLSKPIDKSAMLRACERWLRERRTTADRSGSAGSSSGSRAA